MAEYATIQAQIDASPFIMYSKSTCIFCIGAKSKLQELSIAHELVELNEMPNGIDIQNTLKQITGQNTVPNIFIGGKHVGGWCEFKAGLLAGTVQNLMCEANVSFNEA